MKRSVDEFSASTSELIRRFRSIAFAKSLEREAFPFSSKVALYNQSWVVATDLAPNALALSMANAKSNNVHLDTAVLDHFNQSSVHEMKKRFFQQGQKDLFERDGQFDRHDQYQPYHNGFRLVFGSSLQGLFQDTDRLDSALWKTLDQLLDSNAPNALAILAHNRDDKLQVPIHTKFPYHLVRRISASDEFFGNMKTRAGDVSDFEISILQRRATPILSSNSSFR